MTAATAIPGNFYRTRSGRVLQVVPREDVNGQWHVGQPGAIPYRIAADPNATKARARVSVYGWLPPTYELDAVELS